MVPAVTMRRRLPNHWNYPAVQRVVSQYECGPSPAVISYCYHCDICRQPMSRKAADRDGPYYRPVCRAVPIDDRSLVSVYRPMVSLPTKRRPARRRVIFLIQILVLILVGRVLGEFMQRMGQPAVTGQLIAGILLGHSVFGVLWPDAQHWMFPSGHEQKAMLDGISQLGILMLLLLTGMETDLVWCDGSVTPQSVFQATGIIIPFVCGFVLGEFLPDSMLPRPELRIITSLFLGTALSIASIKIVAMVIREMNFMRRNLGQIIVASAIIDDSIGWIIISIIFSLAEHGVVDSLRLARRFGNGDILGDQLYSWPPYCVFPHSLD